MPSGVLFLIKLVILFLLCLALERIRFHWIKPSSWCILLRCYYPNQTFMIKPVEKFYSSARHPWSWGWLNFWLKRWQGRHDPMTEESKINPSKIASITYSKTILIKAWVCSVIRPDRSQESVADANYAAAYELAGAVFLHPKMSQILC